MTEKRIKQILEKFYYIVSKNPKQSDLSICSHEIKFNTTRNKLLQIILMDEFQIEWNQIQPKDRQYKE